MIFFIRSFRLCEIRAADINQLLETPAGLDDNYNIHFAQPPRKIKWAGETINSSLIKLLSSILHPLLSHLSLHFTPKTHKYCADKSNAHRSTFLSFSHESTRTHTHTSTTNTCHWSFILCLNSRFVLVPPVIRLFDLMDGGWWHKTPASHTNTRRFSCVYRS